MENRILLAHASKALSDPTILRMIDAEGMRGYGIYWALLQLIIRSDNYSIPLSNLGSLALRIGTRPHLLKRVATLYQLFVVKNDRIYAPEQIHAHISTVPTRVDNTVERALEPTVEPIVEHAVEPTVEPIVEPSEAPSKCLKTSKKNRFAPMRPHVRTRASVVDDNNISSDNIINNNTKNACMRAPCAQALGPPKRAGVFATGKWSVCYRETG